MAGTLVVVAVHAVAAFASAPVRAELPPLIPREALFGNSERFDPKISPDGTRLAWLAPDRHDVEQVWVGTVGKDDAKAVTSEKRHGVSRYFWAEDDRTLLFLQDSDGDENFHLYGVDLPSGNVRDLTPFQGVKVDVVDVSPRFPFRVLCAINLRDRRQMDVHAIDLRTGAVELDTQNPGDVSGWFADDNQVVRGASVFLPNGGVEIRERPSAKGRWRSLEKVGPEDRVEVLGFAKDGRSVFLTTSADGDTVRVVQRSLAAGRALAVRELARRDDLDVDDVLMQPWRRVVQAVAFAKGRQEWTVVDPSIAADFAGIRGLNDADFQVVSRDRADRIWLVAFFPDRGPVRYYTWDRSKAKGKGSFLFSHRPKLEGVALAEMKPIVLKARDGLELNGYLTLPVGVPPKGLPLVLVVHGGPWVRDGWGYRGRVQWLANRGYAVLQVNYRGSTGFGKRFMNAGDKQWGGAMQDDLTDAVRWAIAQGIADPRRVAIFGMSYGGYAALAGAAFTPQLYRCAVDEFGPVNLLTWLKNIPPILQPRRGVFRRRVGDPDDAADRELLIRASPLSAANHITIPLLIGQGANDARVPPGESEQIVAAIERNGGRATYVLYPDEGHGFLRPENKVDFTARAEAFLAEHLGGRFEPMTGERVTGSSAVVKRVGASTAGGAARPAAATPAKATTRTKPSPSP